MGYFEEIGDLLNAASARGGDLFHGQGLTAFYFALFTLRFLHIGGVVAFVAVDNLVFAALGNDHELVGVLAADGAAIGFNQQAGQAAAVVDILVRLEHLGVALV